MTDLSGQSSLGNTRALLFGAGDAGAGLSVNRNLAADVASNVPDPNQMSSQVVALLKQYQQGFSNTANTATRDQALADAAPNPSLAGADPAYQALSRNADAASYNPTIGGARAAIQDATTAIQEYQTAQQTTQTHAVNVIASILDSSDPTLLQSLDPKYLAKLETDAGYPKGFIAASVKHKSVTNELEQKKLQAEINALNRSNQPTSGGVGGVAAGVPPAVAADFYVSNGAYQRASSILAAHGYFIDTLTAAQAAKLSDQEADDLGQSFALMANPNAIKNLTPGAKLDYFSPTGPIEAGKQFLNSLGGHKYLAENIAKGAQSAFSQYSATATGVGVPVAMHTGNAGTNLSVGTANISAGDTKVINKTKYVKQSDGLWHKQ